MNFPEDRYVKIKGVNTRYWAAGESGPAVVLVHGLGGFIENWMNNFTALAGRHRVYAVDLLGFGRTDKTPLIHDITDLVKFIDDFTIAMNIEKASFIGNSLGGGLVLQYALDYPAKVDKLVLIDNAGMGREVISDFKFCAIPFLGELLTRPTRAGTARLLHKIIHDPALITPEVIDFNYRFVTVPGAKKALLKTLRAGIDVGGQRAGLVKGLLSRLGSLAVPTLVVWGREDKILPLTHAYIAQARIPGARLEIFDNCSHVPMLEQAERFNRLALEFLAR